jgi:DnaJ-class molecular chaperone
MDEIAQAYRRLSMKHHPDRPTGNKNKYLEVQQAYDVIGDEDKRKQYDAEQTFQMNMNMNFGMDGGDKMPDIFNMMFGGFKPNGLRSGIRTGIHVHPPGGIPINIDEIIGDFVGVHPNVKIYHNNREVNPRVVEPIEKKLTVSLMDAYHGTKKSFIVERWIIHNYQKKMENETIYVDIPKGIDDGEMILLKGRGNQVLDTDSTGDVKIYIHIEKHPELERKGINIHFKKKITFKESLCGFKFNISHIDGKQYCINNQAGRVIYPQFRKIVPNLGILRDGVRGDLVIEFDVEYPREISDECVEFLVDKL